MIRIYKHRLEIKKFFLKLYRSKKKKNKTENRNKTKQNGKENPVHSIAQVGNGWKVRSNSDSIGKY